MTDPAQASPTPEQMERAEDLYNEHRTTGWDGTDVPAAIVAAILQSDQQQAELLEKAEAMAGALEAVQSAWITNNAEGDDYDEGYDDALKHAHDLASPVTAFREYQKGRTDVPVV